MMNTVDSSAWVEYFVDGPNASFFAAAIEDVSNLIVASISLHEVFKSTLAHQNEGAALRAVAQMKQGTIYDLTEEVALNAAKLSLLHRLPVVESIVLATARANHAKLWTLDERLRGHDGVQYKARVKTRDKE